MAAIRRFVEISKSGNCEACAVECPLNELTKTKLASWDLFICKRCKLNDPEMDFFEVFSMLSDAEGNFVKAAKLIKEAQEIQDPELASPNIEVQPAESQIQEAVQRIKSKEPSYFVGVRSIVVSPGSGYGFVESGQNKDPNVIHINLQKIKSDVSQQMSGADQKDINEAIVNAVVETIAHEKGHISGYKPESGFAGEGSAEQESQRVQSKF